MAERSVFITKDVYPFYEEVGVQFYYFKGFALSQKRKNQIGLHMNFGTAYPDKVLEVCVGSLYSLGAALSALNLKKRTQAGITTVESAFQSSRIYGENDEIGPFPELLFYPPKDCKKLVVERSLGLPNRHFKFDGMDFYSPDHFRSLFFDFMYLNALCEEENKTVAERLIAEGYTAFSDLATKSLNSQARSCAIFVSLVKNGLIDQVHEFDSFLRLFRTTADGKPTGKESFENVQLPDAKGWIHPSSPTVPCTFTRGDVEEWYEIHCGDLTNRKAADNFLDLKLR